MGGSAATMLVVILLSQHQSLLFSPEEAPTMSVSHHRKRGNVMDSVTVLFIVVKEQLVCYHRENCVQFTSPILYLINKLK